MTCRLCFACDLVDDPSAIEDYRRWHEPGGPPAGVIARLRERGVVALEIWLTGNRLFMVMELAGQAEMLASDASAHPEDIAWEQRMDEYQRPLAWSGGAKWTLLQMIFALDRTEV